MFILTVDDIRRVENSANDAGYTFAEMVQDAGTAIAERLLVLLEQTSDARLTFLIGKGNNGSDGLVAATRIAQAQPGYQVRCYLIETRADDTLVAVAQETGVHIAYADDDRDGRVIKHMAGSADLIVDAIFGISVRLPIRDAAQRVLRFTRQALNERANARKAHTLLDPTAGGQIARPPHQIVLAVDCPSGLDARTGEADKVTLQADETITFIAAKPGLFLRDGVTLTGRLWVAPLRIGEVGDLSKQGNFRLLDNETVRMLLPQRALNSHKGTFGKVLVVGGSAQYVGAAGLAADAAGRVGAGRVTVAAEAEVVRVLQSRLLSVTWLPQTLDKLASDDLRTTLDDFDAALIGVGLGDDADARQAALKLIQTREHQGWVIDADALNAIAGISDDTNKLTLNPGCIVTPHPAEAGRLLGIETNAVQMDRLAAARSLVERLNGVVVLKGAHTLIASPDGRMACSPFKTDALAKAGTGDVLAGMIAGLRAQGLSPFDAACAGVYVHGLAGTLAAENMHTSRSVQAEDVISTIAEALHQVVSG